MFRKKYCGDNLVERKPGLWPDFLLSSGSGFWGAGLLSSDTGHDEYE